MPIRKSLLALTIALLAGLTAPLAATAAANKFYNKGIGMLRAGNHLEAALWFQSAVLGAEGDLKTVSLAWIGYCYQNAGLPTQAAAYYRQALVLQPNYTDVLRNLAAIEMGRGRQRDALPSLVRLVQQGVRDASVCLTLAVAAARVGDPETAWQALCSAWFFGMPARYELRQHADLLPLLERPELRRITAETNLLPDALAARDRYQQLFSRNRIPDAAGPLQIMATLFRRLDGGKGPFSAWAAVMEGNQLENSRRYPEARVRYTEACTLFRTLQPPRLFEIGWNLSNIGDTWSGENNHHEALAAHRQALALFRDLFPPAGRQIGKSLLAIATAEYNLGNHPAALSNALAAHPILSLYVQSHRVDLANCEDFLGRAARSSRRFATAVTAFSNAAAHWRILTPRGSWNEGESLMQLGGTLLDMEDNQSAYLHLLRALELARRHHPSGHNVIGELLLQLGLAAWGNGDYHQARLYTTQAIDHCTAQSLPGLLVKAHNNLGLIAQSSADFPDALRSFEKALGLLDKHSGSSGIDRVGIHDNMGNVLVQLKDPAKALDHFRLSLQDREKKQLTEPLPYAYSLVNTAIALYTLGRHQEALTHLEKAGPVLKRFYSPTDPRMANYFTNLGLVLLNLDRHTEAEGIFRATASLFRSTPVRDNQILFHFNLAAFYHRRGQREKALTAYQEAVNALMALRRRTPNGKHILSEKFGYIYDYLIPLALELGRPELAFQANNQRRGLTLAEGMDTRTSLRNAGATAAEQDALEQLEAALSRLYTGLTDLLQLPPGAETSARLLAVEKSILRVQQEIFLMNRTLAAKYPRYALLDAPRAPGVATLQKLLDKDEIIIDYLFHGKGLLAFTISRERGLQVLQLADPAEANALAQTVKNLYETFISPSDYRRINQIRHKDGIMQLSGVESVETNRRGLQIRGRLYPDATIEKTLFGPEIAAWQEATLALCYRKLIAPVLARSGTVRKIVLIPNQHLYSLPFHSLLDGNKEPLSKTTALSLVPSTIVWERLRQQEQGRWSHPLLAMGNALYSTATNRTGTAPGGRRGLRSSRNGYADLPGTRQELEDIMRLAYPGSTGTNTHLCTGSRTSEDTLRQLDRTRALAGYRILHFAVHGLYNARAPWYNALVFSQPDAVKKRGGKTAPLKEDGFLKLNEASALLLNSEVVVLSACETFLGDHIAGDGVIGLPLAFLVAGSRGVVASLWPVDDLVTGLFMKNFYEALLRKKLPPREALAATQAAVRGEFPDPFYWAPFVYYGR